MPVITVVALPSDDEIVWDLSSEKKPHLTLLYLNLPLDADQEDIIQFIQHATNTSLSRFGLSVDRRGTLGEFDADVLFFDTTFGVGNLRAFRAQLLKNETISKGYVRTEQFPGWIPHLTMGYPETPAKKPDRDDQNQLRWINFDRIAVWTGDFKGPEFLLKSEFNEVEHSESDWSEEHGVYIMHYGKLGMKWGVRRPIGAGGLVKGTVAAAVKGGQKMRANREEKKEAAPVKGKTEHKTMVKNINKGVENLSTKEIQAITSRIKAINDFKATTAAEKAKKKSTASKIAKWALDQVVAGARNQGGAYIRELTGDTLNDLLPATKSARKRAEDKRKKDEKDAKKKEKSEKKSETKTEPDSTTSQPKTQSRDDAVSDLAKTILSIDQKVYDVSSMPKRGG